MLNLTFISRRTGVRWLRRTKEVDSGLKVDQKSRSKLPKSRLKRHRSQLVRKRKPKRLNNLFKALTLTGYLLPITYYLLPDPSALAEVQLQDVSQTFSQITFNSSPTVANDVDFPGHPKLPDVPKFSWKKGDKLAEVFPIGLLKLMGGNDYTPATAAQSLGLKLPDLLEGKLGNLKFLQDLPLKDVLAANPQLKNIQANSIPGWFGVGNQTLGQLALTPVFGSKPIPTTVLNAVKIKQFPGIVKTPYLKYLNAGSLPVGSFFGLADIGFDKLFNFDVSTPTGLQLVKLDKIGTLEANIGKISRDNVSSGSNKEPYAPCEGGQAQSGSSNTCDYVEFQSVLFPNIRDNRLNGTKSIIGQQLKGGEGLLGEVMTAAGVREPAGYSVPYIGMRKCGSKWSVGEPDARNGTVNQYLNFRICYRTIFGFQASPYFIPIPIGSASEKENTQFLPMKVEPQAQAPVSTQISEIIDRSDLPDAQKSYIKSAVSEIIASNSNNLSDADSILKQAVITSFSGKAVKTSSFNPILGDSDEILNALL
ncbi:hypothetical protein [Merismopedia glauca]|nr:hypothetical protein [Merismopedia glauca]